MGIDCAARAKEAKHIEFGWELINDEKNRVVWDLKSGCMGWEVLSMKRECNEI